MNWTPLPKPIVGTFDDHNHREVEVVMVFYRTDSSNRLEYMSAFGKIYKSDKFRKIWVPGSGEDENL